MLCCRHLLLAGDNAEGVCRRGHPQKPFPGGMAASTEGYGALGHPLCFLQAGHWTFQRG
jgi:hypothetical protein